MIESGAGWDSQALCRSRQGAVTGKNTDKLWRSSDSGAQHSKALVDKNIDQLLSRSSDNGVRALSSRATFQWMNVALCVVWCMYGTDAMGEIPPPVRGTGTKPMRKWGPAEA